MATRRALLGQLALGLGVLACRGSLAQPAEGAVYVGVETSAATGVSVASFFSANGARVCTTPLDFRAHGMARHGRRLVVFPRRPGDRFAVVDLDTLEILAVVTAPEGRHFYGHGAFTLDGGRLAVTENDLETLGGGIGLYEITPRARRLGQIALPGSGPHEIARHPARDVFYIAQGGVQTHPAYGRLALNLGEFRSEIVTWDVEGGALTALGHWAGTEGVSLRHLAMDARGRLYIGGQIEDDTRAHNPNIVWVLDGTGAQTVPEGRALDGYVSSVAAHGQTAVLTSKTAGLALRLDGAEIVSRTPIDGAGAAALGRGLDALSGYAELRINGTATPAAPGHEFDNHGFAL